MSTPVHNPAANPFASYAFQEIEETEDEQEEDEQQDEMEWSDEEYLHSDFEDEFEDDNDNDQFDDDYDCDNEDGDDDDDHEYLDEEEDSSHYKNNYKPGPGYFYPEQPYIGLPIIPKPSPDASSKFSYYVLSPICDIATIYIKFAILAILIYACALLYTVYLGDLSSITDMDNDDADTCPANWPSP